VDAHLARSGRASLPTIIYAKGTLIN